MKALFVCPTLRIGGAERQWAILVPALAARGIDVSVLVLQEDGPLAEVVRQSGVSVVCARMRGRFDAIGIGRAVRLGGIPDIVITRSIDAHVLGHMVARRARAPHVATEHTQYDLLPLRRHRAVLYRIVAPHVNLVVAVSSSQLDALRGLGYSDSSLNVIPNGVGDFCPQRSREEVRATLAIGDLEFLAVLVATLRPEKRADIFVEAIMRARRADDRIRGLIVGDGPEAPRVQALCASTDGSVLSVGARTDVADLVNAADAACLTSAHEVMSMSLLEAAALGKPLVATDVGGTRDIVRTGETGYLVGVGDVEALAEALVALATDSETALAYGRRAREIQQLSFSADRMIDSYEMLLRSAVTGEIGSSIAASSATRLTEDLLR